MDEHERFITLPQKLIQSEEKFIHTIIHLVLKSDNTRSLTLHKLW